MDRPLESQEISDQMSLVRLARLSAAGSFFFAAAFSYLAWHSSSNLAWSQAADSLADVASALVLSWLGTLALKPGDAEHPYGHTRFEPLGALGVAVFSCLLAVQVGREALVSIGGAESPRLSLAAVVPFGLKILFKGYIWRKARGASSPTGRALAVDARNDALLCLLAVVGIATMTHGYQHLDGWLALPIAAWIAWSGVELGLENLTFLVGAAPPAARSEELLNIARNVEQVVDAHDLRAQYLGASLSLDVHIEVDPTLSVRDGHDIGELVRFALLEQADVLHVSVHVDPAE